MDGVPVFLASLSRSDKRGIVATGDWTPAQIEEGHALLREALAGVGDLTRQRLFRMNITLCLHKACTPREVSGLACHWQSARWGLAGTPVEVLWQNVPQSPSCSPCEFPTRHVFDASRPDLWLPEDCGVCDPCVARATLRRQIGF